MHLAQTRKLRLQIHQVVKPLHQRLHASLATDPFVGRSESWFLLYMHMIYSENGHSPL
jgi:hypothetical protein